MSESKQKPLQVLAVDIGGSGIKAMVLDEGWPANQSA